jgi:3-dehydroquinate dehydratase/shikimate dehydrogenase
MAKICVSLIEETTSGIVDRMADLAGSADLFEVRADLVVDLDPLALLRARTRPIVFTCRSAAEGGGWSDSEKQRRLALLEAVKRGFDYVDIEVRSGLLDVMAEKAGKGLIVSYHDLEGTPDDLSALYDEMTRTGADIVKIAVTPRSVADTARLLAFAARARAEGGVPVIPIAMGPLGTISRVAAGRYGAPFTFASVARGSEAGPGQLDVREMIDLYRVRRITPATRVYGILGSDVAHSLSPAIHNRAFEAKGLDSVYVPLQAEDLGRFVDALPALGLSGFSVTRPYKVEMLRFLDEVEESAADCGSANTVVVHENWLRGSSTDGLGVVGPLKRRLELKGAAVVILGAGGAARAAAAALKRKGARVTVAARDTGKGAEVGRSLGIAHATPEQLRTLTWDVLVNATPVGSADAPEETPVPAELHRPGSVVLDMVYDPVETRLLREARERGCTAIDGLEMLVAQAVSQFETWTGLEAPVDVMRAAARQSAEELRV